MTVLDQRIQRMTVAIKQRWIANELGVDERRVSLIMLGRADPSEKEKEGLNRILKKRVGDLFDDAVEGARAR